MSTPQLSVYMNCSATVPVGPRVVDRVIPYLHKGLGSPASRSRPFGWEAEKAVETTREQVAVLVNANPHEVIQTSGATESDNLAIEGATSFYNNKGKHIITVRAEHKAVLDTTRELERQGFKVTCLDAKNNGLVDINVFKQAIRPNTILASVMVMNNEIGVIQDIEQLDEICRGKGVVFHVDATQVTGKVEINLQKLRIGLMSFSAHKTYGPKGIGALYVCRKPRIHIEAQMRGGGHECGMRSDTPATHQIVGTGEAFRIAKEEMATENERIRILCDRLYRDLNTVEEVYVNGDMEARVSHNLNISFNFVKGELLIVTVKDVAVSSGSAYTPASLEPSYVLRALSRNDELAHSPIRFTVGRFITEEEVDCVIELLKSRIGKLHDLSPLWEMYKDSVGLNSIQWAAH